MLVPWFDREIFDKSLANSRNEGKNQFLRVHNVQCGQLLACLKLNNLLEINCQGISIRHKSGEQFICGLLQDMNGDVHVVIQ